MQTSTPSMHRRHDLDWVRVAAFGLLILYHVGMYYVSWDWHVKSPAAGHTLEPLMVLSGPWRLSLLFLVSGAATAFMLAKGEPRFLAGRSWRLLLPLVFGMLVVVPPQTWYEVLAKGYSGSVATFYRLYLTHGLCRDGRCIDTPTWNHLWFVAYLWVYTLLLVLLRAAAPALLARAGAAVCRALSGAQVLVLPALFFIGARLLLIDRFPSTHGLVDDVYNHVQYLAAFLLGYWMARADAVWDALVRQRWPALGVALLTGAALAVYVAAFAEDAPPQALRMAARVAWGTLQWCAIAAVLGFARRWNPGDSALLRYLVPAVFPIYILHQTLIIVLSQQLKPLAWPPVLEGTMLVVLTAVGCWVGYELVRRVRWLRPLFGLKARFSDGAATNSPRHARG